jgi:hypothetical protein
MAAAISHFGLGTWLRFELPPEIVEFRLLSPPPTTWIVPLPIFSNSPLNTTTWLPWELKTVASTDMTFTCEDRA